VWAKLNNFPWWPCKGRSSTTPAVSSPNSSVSDRSRAHRSSLFQALTAPHSRKHTDVLHRVLQPAERAWLAQANVFRYKGIESFKIYAQEQVDRAKEKLTERFQLKVALNRRDQWEQAIEQADLHLRAGESISQPDVNSAYPSRQPQERSRSGSLADSLARLNQINEEKIRGRKAMVSQAAPARSKVSGGIGGLGHHSGSFLLGFV